MSSVETRQSCRISCTLSCAYIHDLSDQSSILAAHCMCVFGRFGSCHSLINGHIVWESRACQTWSSCNFQVRIHLQWIQSHISHRSCTALGNLQALTLLSVSYPPYCVSQLTSCCRCLCKMSFTSECFWLAGTCHAWAGVVVYRRSSACSFSCLWLWEPRLISYFCPSFRWSFSFGLNWFKNRQIQ